MKTINGALKVYAETYKDEMNARSAFVDAIAYLIGGRKWSWDVSPHALTVRAGELILDGHRSPSQQAVIERSVIALSDRLRDDLVIYVSDIYDSVECKWIEFLRDNRGDLESEIALSKIWRGAAWAPCGRHIMLSLDPIYDLMSQDTTDREIMMYEEEENRSFDFDIRKELRRC